MSVMSSMPLPPAISANISIVDSTSAGIIKSTCWNCNLLASSLLKSKISFTMLNKSSLEKHKSVIN